MLRLKQTILLVVSIAFLTTSYAKSTIRKHPRLLFTTEEQVRLTELAKTNEQVASLIEKLEISANEDLKLADIEYNADTRDRMLNTSREYIRRFINLSMAHRLISKSAYIDKINESLLHVCSFNSWHPEHFLDNAEMATAVAIAYDWCYKDLPRSTRKIVEKSLKTKTIDLSLAEYETGDEQESWLKRNTNWNVVCNTGTLMGIMAIQDKYPDIAEQVIANAVKYIPNCMQHFAPDGACYEGPGYWDYTVSYLMMMMKVLDDNKGCTLGVEELEGVSKTAQFYINTTSPNTGLIYNYADNSCHPSTLTPCFFYFGRKFNNPEVSSFYRNLIEDVTPKRAASYRFFYLALPWWDDSDDADIPFNKFSTYQGINDILVLKGNPAKCENPIFIAAKGGDPDEAHQQLDCGSFVLDKYDVRWFKDFGTNNYSLPHYFSYSATAPRWNYFRNVNHSHNTITIDEKNHYPQGRADIIAVDNDKNSATIDMTSLYQLYKGEDKPTELLATDATRKFTLVDDETIEIVDMIAPQGSHSISWVGVTDAKISINDNVATLQQDDKTITVTFSVDNGSLIVLTQKPAKNFVAKEYTSKGNMLIAIVTTDSVVKISAIIK